MCKQLYQWGAHKSPFSRVFFFVEHASSEILETLLQWNLYSGYSLRASSAFGGNREKLMHEWHVRGDAKAGGVGEKGELATFTSKFSLISIPKKTPGHCKA